MALEDSDMGQKGIPRALPVHRQIVPPDYKGPEKERIARDLATVNDALMDRKDLPDRNLTMGEVKALLNQYSSKSPSTPPPVVAPKALPVQSP